MTNEEIAGLSSATGDFITSITPLFPAIGTGLFIARLIADGINRQAGLPNVSAENLAEFERQVSERIESNLAAAGEDIENMRERRRRIRGHD